MHRDEGDVVFGLLMVLLAMLLGLQVYASVHCVSPTQGGVCSSDPKVYEPGNGGLLDDFLGQFNDKTRIVSAPVKPWVEKDTELICIEESK